MIKSEPIILEHNLRPNDFMWLWAKYVAGTNLQKHCTACLKGITIRTKDRGSPYSQKFSKASNPNMLLENSLVMDETGETPYRAIYLCGVAAEGYSTKTNYPNNLHAAVKNTPGIDDTYSFLNYKIVARNGTFTPIPEERDLPSDMLKLPKEYTTCRIFRWAAVGFPKL